MRASCLSCRWLAQLGTLPNLLSLSRALFALAFLSHSPVWRLGAVGWAVLSDGLDGWLARRSHQEQGIGKWLDPLVDKFFVFFALVALWIEQRVGLYELSLLSLRDIVLAIFGLYFLLTGKLGALQLKAQAMGKLFTALQLAALLAICLEQPLPSSFYLLLIGVASLFLLELILWSGIDRAGR